MKTIDLCDGFGGGGCLKQHYLSKGINDYKIYSLGLCLSVGDIKNNHWEFLGKLFQDNNYNNEDLLEELVCNINSDTHIRIWASKKNDNDYLLVLFMCNYLAKITNNISVVFVSDYNEYIRSINALDYKEIDCLLKYEIKLTNEEIKNFSREWNSLVEINSELRVLENGKVNNKKFSDYYGYILNNLKKKAPCTITSLICDCMIDCVINDACDMVYLFIIDQLIELNRIKIIEKGTNHFRDIINLYNNEYEKKHL